MNCIITFLPDKGKNPKNKFNKIIFTKKESIVKRKAY